MEFNIIIDIDGCITNIDFFKYIEPFKYLNPKCVLRVLNNKKHENPSFTDTNTEKIIKGKIKSRILYCGIALYSKKAKVRSDCSLVLNDLKEDGCNLVAITKRPFGTEETKLGNQIRNHVTRHLESHDIPCDKIRYVKSCKVEECTEEKADVIIEDSPKNIKALAAAGFKVICYRTPYNKHITEDIPNVYVATSWQEIYIIIKMLKQDKELASVPQEIKDNYDEYLDHDSELTPELDEEERWTIPGDNKIHELKFLHNRGYFEKNRKKR